MDAQTLQQQTPIYHVCQHCGGDGCAACSDLLILDGDIQLDAEWNDDLSAVAPINGVIGVTASTWKPAYDFIVVWKNGDCRSNCCFTNEYESLEFFQYVLETFGISADNYMVYPDGHLITALPLVQPDPVCSKCGKSRFDSAYGCLSPNVLSPAAGDWVCCKSGAVRGLKLVLSTGEA